MSKLITLLRKKALPSGVRRHPEISRTEKDGLIIRTIAPEITVPVQIVEGGKDDGYHRFGNDWWTNPECPASFGYLSIDAMYPAPYFMPGRGHPSHQIARDLYEYMQRTYATVFGRNFNSVLELGSGGGEITAAFLDEDLDFVTVEGTTAGVERLRETGIPDSRIVLQNLKFMPKLDRRFDLVMCTEVAEHIEPFFASKVVENCIVHADAVWFSAADRNRKPHYHHLNEQAVEAWDNLFAHMGFGRFAELDGRHGRASRLYMPA